MVVTVVKIESRSFSSAEIQPFNYITENTRPNKTRPASLLNGFKHDYKFNRYTALLYSLYKEY
jgi:hypothetical protein